MTGGKWVRGSSRAFGTGALAFIVLGAQACSGNSAPSSQGEGGVSPSLDEGPGAGGEASMGVGVPVGAASCVSLGTARPVFTDQIFDLGFSARRELYSWTTDEQALELRQGRVLFSNSDTGGLGPGYAFAYLEQLASSATDPDQAALARSLGGDLFHSKRYAWPEPWATRMGWPGEDYGKNLLRIVLRPEAWLVVIRNGRLSVLDLDDARVAPSDVLTNPSRIGAILYVKDAAEGGSACVGSLAGGSNGYREFIVGNASMIEEWSIGTAAMRERLLSNIDQLTRFLGAIRGCSTAAPFSLWNSSVVCAWDSAAPPTDEISTYEQALAIPSDFYFPEPERIAALIDTLQNDLFEPDPLVVAAGDP